MTDPKALVTPDIFVMTNITSISLEHTEYLGVTIGAIAGEKAGILKPNVPVIFDANEEEATQVIEARAKELSCPYYGISKNMCHIQEIKRNFIEFSISTRYDKDTRWHIPFAAEYQVMNAALAIAAMRCLLERGQVSLRLEEVQVTDALQKTLARTRWAGRMEEVEPDVFLDGAHNLAGVTAFVAAADKLCGQDAELPILLFSMVKEKDYKHAIQCLAQSVKWGAVLVATIPNQRGNPAEELQQIFAEENLEVTAIDDYKKAYDRAYSMKKEGQKLFCTGSLYFIGALKEHMNSRFEEEHND